MKNAGRFLPFNAVAGWVLVTAAALKSVAPARSSARSLHEVGGLAESVFEVSLGLLLISGLWREPVRLIALLTFSIFAAVAFHEAVIGLPSCGCFGALEVNPWYTAGFDVLMVLGLAWTMPEKPVVSSRLSVAGGQLSVVGSQSSVVSGPLSVAGRGRWNSRRLGWTIAGLCGVALVAVGVQGAYARGRFQYVGGGELGVGGGESEAAGIAILEPEKWIGKPLPILKQIDIGHQLGTGSWTAVLYHADCPACREAIPRFERAARRRIAGGEPPAVALIEMPPYAAGSDSPVSHSSPCLLGKLSDKREWFATTPVVLSMRDGIVVSAAGAEKAKAVALLGG